MALLQSLKSRSYYFSFFVFRFSFLLRSFSGQTSIWHRCIRPVLPCSLRKKKFRIILFFFFFEIIFIYYRETEMQKKLGVEKLETSILGHRCPSLSLIHFSTLKLIVHFLFKVLMGSLPGLCLKWVSKVLMCFKSVYDHFIGFAGIPWLHICSSLRWQKYNNVYSLFKEGECVLKYKSITIKYSFLISHFFLSLPKNVSAAKVINGVKNGAAHNSWLSHPESAKVKRNEKLFWDYFGHAAAAAQSYHNVQLGNF